MNERAVFDEALSITDPDERARFLDEACGIDTEARRTIDRMLGVQHELGSFLEHPVVENVKTELVSGEEPPQGASGTKTVPQIGDTNLDFLRPSDDPNSLGRLDQYEILDVIGRGGMGLVLKARDTELNRIVAVKVLAPELASNATGRKRFGREAQAAAAVSHDHVVPIFAVNDKDGNEKADLPYLVMEYIDGQSLQQKIDEDSPLELKEILRIGQQVAAGLSAAHLQGLIHRDVKPSNVLLQNGVQRVKITDFGLARAVDDVGITRTGEVAGTPQYMSPEQAQGQGLDPRSDLFSLGSVMYAMCTGRGPFRADTAVASLRRVCDDTPRPIRAINADIPIWLVDIIDCLLEKDPQHRYQSAEEVSELLAKCLSRLQEVGPTSMPGIVIPRKNCSLQKTHSRKQHARGKWLVTAMLLLAFGLMFGVTEATGVTDFSGTVIRLVTGEGTLLIEVDDPTVQVSLDGEELSITGAGLQELKLRPGQYQFTAIKNGKPVKQELVSISRGGRQVVRVSLDSPDQPAPPPVEPLDYTSTPAGAITLVRQFERNPDNFVRRLAFTPDGRHFVCAARELLEYWDSETGDVTHLGSWPDDRACNGLAVSPDGRFAFLGYGNKPGPLLLWDLETGEKAQEFAGNTGKTNAVAFTPDGRHVLSSHEDKSARLWDVSNGEEVWKVQRETGYGHLAIAPSGDRALLGSDPFLQLVDIESGEEIWRTAEKPTASMALAFSPDGHFIVSGENNGWIQVWDAETGEQKRHLRSHKVRIDSICFSPDGRHFISGSQDKTLRLWSFEAGQVVAQIDATHQFTQRVAISPDGRYALSGGGHFSLGGGKYESDRDTDIRLWQLPESVWSTPTASDPPSAPEN